MKKLREFLEMYAFGVCSAIGDKLGIASSRIRTWFIYISFLTMGSPIIIYMILAFWILFEVSEATIIILKFVRQ